MAEQTTPIGTFPVSPPRVRVEWLIAAVRVALAVSALLAMVIAAPNFVPSYIVAFVFVVYLLYGLAVLALVWSPVQFGRGWALAVHVFDLVVFALAATMTDVVTSPFFASFAFIVVSASLRWRRRGTVITVVTALLAYALVSVYGAQVLQQEGFQPTAFFIRIVYLVTIAVLLGNFAAMQQRSQQEIVELASPARLAARREIRRVALDGSRFGDRIRANTLRDDDASRLGQHCSLRHVQPRSVIRREDPISGAAGGRDLARLDDRIAGEPPNLDTGVAGRSDQTSLAARRSLGDIDGDADRVAGRVPSDLDSGRRRIATADDQVAAAAPQTAVEVDEPVVQEARSIR